MKPLKATLLALYGFVSLVVLGVSFSHFWRVNVEFRNEEKRQKPAPSVAVQPVPLVINKP